MPSPVVRRNLACIGCGYDLEGLPARGNCPECGRAIVESLAERLDLGTDAQPAARGSARLGWALLVAVAGAFCGTGMLATVVFEFLRLRPGAPAAAQTAVDILRAGPQIALAGTVAAAIALLVLAPLDRSRLSLGMRCIAAPGFAAWAACAWLQPSVPWLIGAGLAAALALAGLAPLYAELGPRSKVYRSRRSAAQRIGALNIAILVASCLAAVDLALDGVFATSAPLVRALETTQTILALVSAASAATVVLGLGYLLTNAVWILRALLRPAPAASEVLGASNDPEPR